MLRATVLSTLAAALLLAAPASGARVQCPDGFTCHDVVVPLDRSGGTAGTLTLPVIVQRGTGPVLVALGGGPGQGMVSSGPGLAGLLGPSTKHRIAFFDQRGTGATALRCPSLQRLPLTDFTVPPAGTVRACGTALGLRRGFYSTTDSVADLDAVRAAIGVDRIAVLGISYGTYLAERYARAHPDHVSAIILDSVVPQTGVDPFLRSNLRRAGSDLGELCARHACRGITTDAAGDLAAVVRRAAGHPITGRVRTSASSTARVTLDGPALFDAMTTWASFLQGLLARVPAALAEARRGRPASLLRLAVLASRGNAPIGATELSWGLHSATLCADLPTPWGGPASDPATRAAAAATVVAGLPASTFAPFDAATARGNGVVDTCEGWPATSVAPPPAAGPLPAVPTLVIAGGWDMSTPSEDAYREARWAPDPDVVVVPRAGHSVLTGTQCGVALLQDFFAGRATDRTCAANRAPVPVAQPRTVSALPGDRRARVRSVVALTLGDAGAVGAVLSGAGSFGGLFGGTLAVDRRGTLSLRGDALLAGAPVTGRVTPKGGRLHVGGRLNADVTLRRQQIVAVRLR